MFVQGETLAFTWVLEPTDVAGANTEAHYDISITTPSGVQTYYEGGVNTVDSFVAPGSVASDTQGSLTESLALTELGVYTIVLSTGTASSYTVLANDVIMVVSNDTTTSRNVEVTA